MAIDYRATTSLPALGAANLPSTGVGEYINQQIIGAQNRSVEAKRNAFQPQTIMNRDQRAVQVSTNPTQQDTVGRTGKMISDTNKKLFDYAQQAQQRAATANTSNTGNIGNDGWARYNTYTIPAGVTGSRAQAMRLASSYLGNPYVFAGTSHQGIDCSGLVKVVYSQLGYNIAAHSASWQRDNIPGVRTNDISSLRPGDIVAWRDGSHIAIYAGNGEIIEAQNPRTGVVRDKIWSRDVIGIKLRFPGE